MTFFLPCLGYRLPKKFSTPLFGDRDKWGKSPNPKDQDWITWENNMYDIYLKTQKQGLGKFVNDAGYKVLQKVDLAGKHVLEIGPGSLPHMAFWNSKPAKFTFIDRRCSFLETARGKAESLGIEVRTLLNNKNPTQIRLADNVADIVLSFYTLEHLHPLDKYLAEISRVLKPGGLLVGAIPAEGGLAWGLGRFLTSRYYMKSHHSFDPDKIICWEHPNFSDQINRSLCEAFTSEALWFWPTKIPSADLNLVISFIYRASSTE